MFKLRSSGVTSEASELFLTVTPPKGERSEDNPNDYEIVCDFFCYVPLPEWYVLNLFEDFCSLLVACVSVFKSSLCGEHTFLHSERVAP